MPTSNDRRKLASRTRGLEASTASRIRIDRFSGLGRLEEGEVDCPVCTYPARRLDIDEPGVMKSRYYHAGRWVPCASPQRILTVTELAELLPPVRWVP